MTLPTLSGLEAFEAVVRLGSFTDAARELHVTQSAISHRVRALEEQLECALFVRSPRGVEPTEEGRSLARGVEDAFARLRGALADFEGARRGVLTVSCSPSFAIRFLVPRLPEFRRAHPAIDLRIAADDRLVSPGAGGIDACLRYGAGEYEGVDLTRLAVEHITPVCSPALLSRTRLTTPRDLAKAVLLHDEVLRDHPGRIGWRQWLDAAGAKKVDARRGPRFSHAHMALEAAVAGQGVALGRTTLVRRDLDEGRLVAPFPLALQSGLAYWFVSPRGAPDTPRVAAFREWLLAAVR